ncbi:MAG: hypothetical protein AB7S26_13970 [Sandaracinaceae bacterium]
MASIVVVASGLALVGVASCAATSDAGGYVAEASADSQRASDALASGEPGRAIEALEALVARSVPADLEPSDARVILQDAHERLARLYLAAGDTDRAAMHVADGLALGDADDLFCANLYTTSGRVHEARGEDVEAATAYERAMAIHETLLDQELGVDP